MSALRVVVCDDEPLAVRRLVSMLEACDGVGVVGRAGGGREAVALVRDLAPDVVFLDVEMPEVDGFDVIEALARGRPERPPLFALVTAYRRFAPQAFDSGAIDFLSKPVRAPRLDVALGRARRALTDREAGARLAELEATLDRLRNGGDPGPAAEVWVARRGEMVRVDLDRIDRVAAEGAYVRLHVGDSSYLHREPIGGIARRLDASRFVRVHRSHVVRADLVRSIRRTVHGGGELLLAGGDRLPLGRKYASDARRRLVAGGAPAGGEAG